MTEGKLGKLRVAHPDFMHSEDKPSTRGPGPWADAFVEFVHLTTMWNGRTDETRDMIFLLSDDLNYESIKAIGGDVVRGWENACLPGPYEMAFSHWYRINWTEVPFCCTSPNQDSFPAFVGQMVVMGA